MNWNTCHAPGRFGQNNASPAQRTPYERDFDRLIFSSAFRRLQDKTQVFPLPGPVLVHNRLTHSLEVASVGRSIGKLAGEELLASAGETFTDASKEFYAYNLSSVIAAACLAHDIGNPSFGHSGEAAISAYFEYAAPMPLNGSTLRAQFTDAEWKDLTNFEGNANSFRILTHPYAHRQPGGYRLTFSTLAAIAKYPCESTGTTKGVLHKKKYGFFQADKAAFSNVAEQTNMIPDGNAPLSWKRHPFVFLVEAADDICYRIIDWEDAHRIGILDAHTASTHLINLLETAPDATAQMPGIKRTMDELKNDPREQLAYLRAKCINYLVVTCAKAFAGEQQNLLNGTLDKPLLDLLPIGSINALENINQVTIQKIYNHETVVKIELAGYEVMKALLEEFIPAMLSNSPTHKQKKILKLLPAQFSVVGESTPYLKALSVVDFISGMTDLYAMEMYKNLRGISLPVHSS